MANYLGYQLKATGCEDLPDGLILGGLAYLKLVVFKHDFFAATALYSLPEGRNHPSEIPFPSRIVLKMARTVDFMGLPLTWLGRALCQHEIAMLKRLEGLEGVPRLLGRLGQTGMIYEYIEGCSLDEKPAVPDNYFSELSDLINRIHQRRIAYIDMNKRGNLLLGAQGRPNLIDFQIACYIPPRMLLSRRLTNRVLRRLQKEDLYHLNKHKRRLRKDLLTESELAASRQASLWITAHRTLTRPLTRLRRFLLGYLYRTNRLITGDTSILANESDPSRWVK